MQNGMRSSKPLCLRLCAHKPHDSQQWSGQLGRRHRWGARNAGEIREVLDGVGQVRKPSSISWYIIRADLALFGKNLPFCVPCQGRREA